MNETGLCDSAGAINHALGVYANTDLVQKAYEARSRRLAHLPQRTASVDPTLLGQLREYARTTLLKFLDDLIF